jgi:CBS domain-containing protein
MAQHCLKMLDRGAMNGTAAASQSLNRADTGTQRLEIGSSILPDAFEKDRGAAKRADLTRRVDEVRAHGTKMRHRDRIARDDPHRSLCGADGVLSDAANVLDTHEGRDAKGRTRSGDMDRRPAHARSLNRKGRAYASKEVPMYIKDVMSAAPACCEPSDNVETVARLMVDRDCGEIPVCEGKKLLGVITDRDIACRVVATGKTATAVQARDVMTRNVVTVREDAKLDEALDLMEQNLVRRLPVVGDAGEIIGIVSQADLAAKMPTLRVARALRNVAKKTRPRAFAVL